MKKYYIYTGLLLAGLLAGWLFFGSSSEDSDSNQIHSENSGEIWTCSMHPQIRKNEPGDCPICGMDLIRLKDKPNEDPLVFTMSNNAMKIANIQTTTVGSSDYNDKDLIISGKIKSDETVSASVVSHVSGRIEKLYISYTGQQISAGQKVALIYSPQLIAAQKELLEASKVKTTNSRLYKSAVNKLKNWKLNETQINTILESQTVVETFAIYSQFSGVVTAKRVAVGDYLKEGEVLFDLQSLSKVWAVFDVYEKDLASVKVGDPITFTTTSYPEKEFTAKISFIDPLINPSTRTVSVRANVSNSDAKLKPEMFIDGWIENAEEQVTNLLVPKSAVLWTGKRSVVYLKLPDKTIPSFEYRNVEIGESMGNSYRIISGLKQGDEVVTNGAFVIDASAQLNNQASMMNQNLVGNDKKEWGKDLTDLSESTSPQFKGQINQLLKGYYNLKNSLVNDDVKLAKESAALLLKSLEKVDMSLLGKEGHRYWMESEKSIRIDASKIAQSESLEEQRKVFGSLSDAVIVTIKVYGFQGKTFEQYCPMWSGKSGGKWLSESKEVRNPYYGASMLTCGEVKNEIQK